MSTLVRVAALTAALALIDIVLRLRTPGMASPIGWHAVDFGIYALGLLASATLWLFASWLDARWLSGRRVARQVFWFVGALVLGAMFFVSFGYRSRFLQLPSWQVLAFACSEPLHAARVVAVEFTPLHGLAFFGLSALVWVSHQWPSARPSAPDRRVRYVGAALLAGCTLCVAVGPGFQEPLPVEANALAAIAQYALSAAASPQHLVAPVRPAIPRQPMRPHPCVLMIVHENLRADAVFPDVRVYGTLPASSLSPYGSSLPARRADGFFTFRLARANSTATESSVPTILSGIDLGGSSTAHRHAHSIWSLGTAVGASTFLVSAQSYRWSHLDEYFFDQNLELSKTGTDIGGVVVNDTGIDDAIAVDALLERLRELAEKRTPFVGVMHFNGTHTPYWPGPDGPRQPQAARYEAAVRYLDRQVARIIGGLDRLGLAGDTIVLSTADHGEPKDRPDHVERLGSFNEESVRVPIWIRVPPQLLVTHPDWERALDGWRARNVQNIDILPTVRDLIGLEGEPAVNDGSLPGRSLVRMPEKDEPVLAGQSTCAFRAWASEGFYLVRGSLKLIVANDRPAPRLYDLDLDPGEEHDLWSDPSWRARVLPWIEASVRAGEERSAVCRRLAGICPVPLAQHGS